MRKVSFIASLGASLGACALASSASYGQNLVVNPSFELPALAPGSEAPGAGAGWNPYGGVFRQNLVPALAHEGTTYIKTFGNGGVFQDVPVVPGQAFSASAWATTSVTDTGGGAVIGGQLLVIFRNAANNGESSPTLVDVIVDQTNPQDVYQQGTLSGTVPAGTGFIRFQLNQFAAGGGAVFFDDASLVVPEPATLAALSLGGLLLRRRRA